jgi:RHS repeat-associated protein
VAGNWYAQNFSYDSRDRNIAIAVQDGNRKGETQYLYNALGERVSKERTGAGRDHADSHGHARYIYDGQGLLLAEATDGQATKDYVYIDGLPVAVLDGGQVFYIHTDHLGSPQKMTDERQQIVWDRVSKPFGDTLAIAGTANLNLRFPGQYHDAETGLDYNLFRSYNSEIGGYTQSDPIGLGGGLNTFGYAGQNPVNSVDPLGLNAAMCTANGNQNANQQDDNPLLQNVIGYNNCHSAYARCMAFGGSIGRCWLSRQTCLSSGLPTIFGPGIVGKN